MRPGPEQALDQLHAVEEARPGAVEVITISELESETLVVEIAVDCRGIEHAPEGIQIRARERFRLIVPESFPFRPPAVLTPHTRWSDSPHVQWRRSLCLYGSIEAEWNPSDGMFGFLDRLREWLQAAAKGELDPEGAPLHPPVAYTASGTPMFVPRADAPTVDTMPWIGLAHLDRHGDRRFDITDWTAFTDLSSDDLGRTPFAAAVLLLDPMPFEYPEKLGALLTELDRRGVAIDGLIRLMWLTARFNHADSVHVVVGTPMRGIAGGDLRQHLSVWRTAAEAVDRFKMSIPQDDDTDALAEARSELRDAMLDWAKVARVEWCSVREARAEVLRPRDEGSPVRWWADRTVEVWGCGALGSRLAEHLCRANVRRLVLRDQARVAPGVLTRQNFEDEDIGTNKAHALATRLNRIRPDLDVVPIQADLTSEPTVEDDWSSGADVLFDATASPTVSKRLELLRGVHTARPSVVGMIVGHEARNGLIVASPAQATGGPADGVRKAKIAAGRRPELSEFAHEFWPDPPRSEIFQPEPGCSSPTFTGSDAEVTALASTMFLTATERLRRAETNMSATFVSLPIGSTPARTETLPFPSDVVLEDRFEGYEIRIAATALAEIRAWVRNSERLRPGDETGGILFGERDDALRVLWVTDVLGPPPDSESSPDGFLCGTAGVDTASSVIRRRSLDAAHPVGMWHTHPQGDPAPSAKDFRGMDQVIGSVDRPLPKQLLLIIGGSEDRYTVGAYLHDRRRRHPPRNSGAVTRLPSPSRVDHKIGLALSGGGFRAVAFHLGVLRALHDREVLDQVDVISSVSGGSLIGALWAYGPDDFATFDEEVTELLRTGLNRRIARALLLSRRTPQTITSTLAATIGRLLASGATTLRRFISPRSSGRRPPRVEPPFRQWITRTAALQDVLTEVLGDVSITNPTKKLHVILNACDLRSGSAFRFGSSESGCSRYGSLADNEVPVALAVACSAAYPVFLPALDLRWEFRDRSDKRSTERVLLTDGGVFDNLGTSPLEPGRDPSYSTNVHPVDFIISADAGRGVLDADAYPLWWPSRMKRSFESVYRKVQDGGKGSLFQHGAQGTLKGFAMPFLGQRDDVLPLRPPDLVTREEVVDYPTNFSRVSKRDLDLLSRRGEQLTRLMIEHYCPDLA